MLRVHDPRVPAADFDEQQVRILDQIVKSMDAVSTPLVGPDEFGSPVMDDGLPLRGKVELDLVT